MEIIENKAKQFKYNTIFQKAVYVIAFLLGIPFGISILSFVPFAIAYLLLDKTRLNYILTPMMMGAWLGILVGIVLVTRIYTIEQSTFELSHIGRALFDWLEGELIFKYYQR